MKKSCFNYVRVLQADYGYGWVDVCRYDSDSLDELSSDLIDYIENEPLFAHRIITILVKEDK